MIKSFVLAGILTVSCVMAQEPDNTKKNERDRATGAVTADQQKGNPSDRELARKIRKSVYDDKTLSTYAHNVKIIVRDGAVTLRGPVRSEAEKDDIGKKAVAVAGAAKVTNEIEIAPEKNK